MAQRLEEEEEDPVDIVQLQLKANKAFCSIDGRGRHPGRHQPTYMRRLQLVVSMFTKHFSCVRMLHSQGNKHRRESDTNRERERERQERGGREGKKGYKDRAKSQQAKLHGLNGRNVMLH